MKQQQVHCRKCITSDLPHQDLAPGQPLPLILMLEGDWIGEIEVLESEYTCPNCNMGYVGDLAVEQRKRFEDACEDCGIIYSCNTCNTEVDHDTPCPNGCDEETTEIVNRILGGETQ